MTDQRKLEEIEKRVDELRREAHELKVLIHSLKRQKLVDEQRISDKNQEHVTAAKEQISSWESNPKVKPKQKQNQDQPIDWEKQIGQIWLPRIFIFVLLLGVVWAFKAASDYGFLNDSVKIVIGYLSAFLLVYLGLLQIKKKRSALGQVLLGGSVVLLLIVTFAMHVLYDLIPMVIAFPLNIVWIFLGIYFANLFNSQPLAVVTAIGGYLIPFLLESQNPSVINFVFFETIFYGALLAFAMLKGFNILYHVGFAFLHFTLLAGALILSHGELEPFAIAIIIQHLLLLLCYLVYQSFAKQQLGIVFGSFLLMVAWSRASFQIDSFEWLLLVFLALYTGLSVYFWQREKTRLPAVLSMASLAVLFFLVSRFEIDEISGILVIQGLLSIYLGSKAESKLKQIVGACIYLCSSYVIFLVQFSEVLSIESVNWLILVGSMFVLPILISKIQWIKDETRVSLAKILHVLTMILVLIFITLTVSALTDLLSLSMQYMMVSFAWALYAFVGIVVGSIKDHKPFRVFGLVLLFVTLGKLIFFDLSYVSIFIRAILFIGLGVIGILGSRVFYRGNTKKSNNQ